MASTSVVGALGKLIPYLCEIWKKKLDHAASAPEEFDNLRSLIKEIEYTLEKAYSKEVIDEELKMGIKRMQNLLYDSQDAIEDLWQRKSKGKWKSPESYFCHRYGDRTFADESRKIKARLLNYIHNLGITDPIEAHFSLSGNQAHSSSAGDGSSSDAFIEKTLVGIEEPMGQLVRWLTENPPMPKVIFVHGAQGVGKTALVGAVLRVHRVRHCFKYFVWIEDLRSCEFADNIAAALLQANATMWDLSMEGVNSRPHQVKLGQAFNHMKEEVGLMPNNFTLGRLTKRKNFSWALVLDDAGKEDVFKFLKSHLIETRPSVLVTTRDKSLKSSSTVYLSHIAYNIHDFELVFLSEKDSHSLFSSNISSHHVTQADVDRMLRRCQGLPLMILATCKLLEDAKDDDVTGDSDAARWKKLSDGLEKKLLSRGHKVGPNGKMITLRMDQLLDVSACLFYLSIFPLDRPIRCSTMMRLWMAEGFIQQDPLQEEAKKTLQKLLDHNVIWGKKTSYQRVKTCHVHNLQHQIIISFSKDVEIATIVARPEEGLPENVRYLSVQGSLDEIDKRTSVKRLRSLHVFKEVNKKSLKELLEKVERLKVLRIQRPEEEDNQGSLNSFPEKILQLKYLRFLSLRGTNVGNIPTGMKGLAHLETLDLKDTRVHELPNDILKLEKLRHLLVYRSDRSPAAGSNPKIGVKLPSALGILRSLQKLCMIELKPVKQSKSSKKKRKRGQLLEGIGTLVDLQRLGISKLRSEDVQILCSSIAKLTKLEALHLIVDDGEKLDLSGGVERKEHKLLQRVYLTGCLGTLPKWILSPTNLVKLALKGSQLNGDQFQYLGELQNLKHLDLQKAFNEVSVMTFGEGGFQRLHFLGMDEFDNLTSINVQEGALPTLERLFLGRCKLLTTLPQVITLPPKLTCLKLYGMRGEFMTEIRGNEEVCRRIKIECKVYKEGAIKDVLEPLEDCARLPQARPSR